MGGGVEFPLLQKLCNRSCTGSPARQARRSSAETADGAEPQPAEARNPASAGARSRLVRTARRGAPARRSASAIPTRGL